MLAGALEFGFGAASLYENMALARAAQPGRIAAESTTRATYMGLESSGFRPLPGTRQIPEGIPGTWRIRPADTEGGVWYYDPKNKGNAVRVMQGKPDSQWPNSRLPYVRWQRNGQPLDAAGNVLPSKMMEEAHIPLEDFRFNVEVFK